jgi:hypothetical protein
MKIGEYFAIKFPAIIVQAEQTSSMSILIKLNGSWGGGFPGWAGAMRKSERTE